MDASCAIAPYIYPVKTITQAMQIKTITYQRVLNLGNYESKRLEMSAEIHETDNIEAETSHLMEMVESKIREDVTKEIESKIRELKNKLRELKNEYSTLESSLKPEKEVDIDDIPFDSTSSSSNPDNF